MRLMYKSISVVTRVVIKVNKCHIRNFAKIVNQEHVTPLTPETLTGRIFLYLNTDNEKYFNALPSKIQGPHGARHNAHNLYKLKTDEIMNFLNSLVVEKDKTDRVLLINEIDAECCLRLNELDNRSILQLLNICMKLSPNRITELKFYKLAVNKLADNLGRLPKNDLLQLIFYLGLQKKNPKNSKTLNRCIILMRNDFINDLTAEELCTICNSTFKTSTRISNSALLEGARNYIIDNLNVLKDPALFITLVKTIRHNKYQNDNLLETISCAMFFNKTLQYYLFPSFCHIMALYADYLYYDERIFEHFTKKCLEELEKSSFSTKSTYLLEQLRGKDIKRFLWVLSNFSEIKLLKKSDFESIIIPKLVERMQYGEFNNDPDSLIEMVLYMWMLNYRAYELIPKVLTRRNIASLAVKSKSKLRLNLLLHCIFVEEPELYKKLNVKPANYSNDASLFYQLKQRPMLTHVLEHLKRIGPEMGLKFEVMQAVPSIMLAGICGYRKNGAKAVYVEVLDHATSVKNVDEDTPAGVMALKIRLLEHCDEGLLVISQNDIEDMTEAQLRDYLTEELRLIC